MNAFTPIRSFSFSFFSYSTGTLNTSVQRSMFKRCMKQKYHNNHICDFYSLSQSDKDSSRHIATHFTSYLFSSFSFYRLFGDFFVAFFAFFLDPVGFSLFMFAKRLNMVSHSYNNFMIYVVPMLVADGVFVMILSNLCITVHCTYIFMCARQHSNGLQKKKPIKKKMFQIVKPWFHGTIEWNIAAMMVLRHKNS